MTTTATRPPKLPAAGGRESRTFSTRLEARDDGDLEYRIDGYASVVDVPYDMGGYTETITRGAFTKTLSERPDVMLLTNHEGLPLARTTLPPGQPGHLSLSEDYQGLRVSAQLDRNDPDARTLVNKIRSGLLDQMSFAFKVTRQAWSEDYTQRSIKELSLDRGDVSVVNFGASPTTSVDARARQGPAGNLSLAQARARALRLHGTPVSRTRHLMILNEAGRTVTSLAEARAIALRLKGQR